MKQETFVEILTPKQNVTDIDAALATFSNKYERALDLGHTVSIPDNPMGVLRFQAIEVLTELQLRVPAGRVLMHVNSFHTRSDLDHLLRTGLELGIERLLLVSGDGGARLSRLTPEAIGGTGRTATSVDLLDYMAREYRARFKCGVAYNPYEPTAEESDKLKRKLAAGASFVVTQPIVGADPQIDPLTEIPVPVVLGAWMSTKLNLLSECVGYAIDADLAYDPEANLVKLREAFPDFGIYLALVGFRTQLPHVSQTLAEAA